VGSQGGPRRAIASRWAPFLAPNWSGTGRQRTVESTAEGRAAGPTAAPPRETRVLFGLDGILLEFELPEPPCDVPRAYYPALPRLSRSGASDREFGAVLTVIFSRRWVLPRCGRSPRAVNRGSACRIPRPVRKRAEFEGITVRRASSHSFESTAWRPRFYRDRCLQRHPRTATTVARVRWIASTT
jgi:hypothetical protein